jgi:hypothetical protein
MMTFHIGAPQLVYCGLFVFVLIHVIINHGKPRQEKYNAFITLLGGIIQMLLLYWGGFFAGR